jgi:hypothetical protein
MTKTTHGIIRGNTIELVEALGMPEGQQVEFVVRTIPKNGAGSSQGHQPGDGFKKTEGALADDAEWDDIMAEIHAARK